MAHDSHCIEPTAGLRTIYVGEGGDQISPTVTPAARIALLTVNVGIAGNRGQAVVVSNADGGGLPAQICIFMASGNDVQAKPFFVVIAAGETVRCVMCRPWKSILMNPADDLLFAVERPSWFENGDRT